jgi:hypothetical protein
MFYTVKLMIDHLMLFNDNSRHAENIICGIDSCMFRSTTVIGYRLYVRRNHPDDWCRQRYKRLIHSGPKTATPKNFVNENRGTDDGEQEDVENVGEQFVCLFGFNVRFCTITANWTWLPGGHRLRGRRRQTKYNAHTLVTSLPRNVTHITQSYTNNANRKHNN